MPRQRSVTLSVYLMKEGIQRPQNILIDRSGLSEHPVRIGRQRLGTLYLKEPVERPPGWLALFDGFLTLRLLNKSTSAVFLVPAGERTYAIAFGYGRALLDPAAFEEQFGLKVTLNAVVGAEQMQIRSVDRLSLDSAQHSRIQATRLSPIGEFGIDVDRDLVRAVTGMPHDQSLGCPLTGKDALKTTVKLSLPELPGFLQLLLSEYGKQDYKNGFAWVDQIKEINNPVVRAQLDDQLVAKLRAGDLGALWLAAPEILDWTRIKTFKYRDAKSAPEHLDLHARDFLDELRDPSSLVLDDLRRRRVHAVSSENDQVTEHWTIYRCLYAELARGQDTFVLTNGAWYRIDRNFVQQVDSIVDNIPSATAALPAFADKDEETYNARVAQFPGFALMDRQNIAYPGGPDKIELCDLYSQQREFIHVKQYAGSAPLSHLFAQGVVSAELFLQDPDFRRRANAILPPTHQLPQDRPDPTQYQVVYGIVSGSANPLRLPFFSRVTLRNAYRRLTGFGYKVALAKIARQPVQQAAA